MSSWTPVLGGLESGSQVVEFYSQEQTNHVGYYHYPATAALQGLLLGASIKHVATLVGKGDAFANVGVIQELSYAILPAFLSWGVSQSFKNPHIHFLFLSTHDALPHLCFLVNLVTSVAAIYFGSALYGGISLSLMMLGLINQYATLPPSLHTNLNRMFYGVSHLLGLVNGSFLVQLASGFDLAVDGLNYFLEEDLIGLKKDETPRPKVEWTDLFENGTLKSGFIRELEVDTNHLLDSILPMIQKLPEGTSQDIITFATSIDWSLEKNSQALNKYIKEDDRAKIVGKDEEGSSFLLTSLQGFISEIEKYPDPIIVTMLKKFAGFIQRPEVADSTKIDLILKIGIEGGNYCSPKKVAALQEIFLNSVVLDSSETGFKERLILLLHNHRKQCFDSWLTQLIPPDHPIYWIAPINDMHTYNTILSTWGQEFHLFSLSAQNDVVAQVTKLDKILFLLLGRHLNVTAGLSESYTVPEIIKYIKEVRGTTLLPITTFYVGFNEWADENLSGILKDHYDDLAVHGKLENHDAYLAFLLVQLGVFKKRNPVAN